MYRTIWLLGIILVCFIVFTGRMLYVQAVKEVDGQNLEELAQSRWTTSHELQGERGTIFDRQGNPLAEEVQSYSVYAVLDATHEEHVEDPEMTAETLAPYIDMDEERLKELLSLGETEGRYQVELGSGARHLSHSTRAEIEELELPGIRFRTESRRFYPNQVFASHVLGYTERDMSEARMGLESGLNEYLTPEDGFLSYQRDQRGVPLLDSNESFEEPQNGDDVTLTIDSNIQTTMEQAMNQVEEEYDPEKITAVAANAKTGQILAMSNRPSFNPNEYEEITNFTNFAVADRFEPGSTMKIFTLAAAIEEGVYDGEEEFESGSYEVGSHRLHDHNNGQGWGEITFNEGFYRSSNVAFAKLAMEKLRPERLYDYITDFGFRETTGVDLPGEASSLIAEQYKIDAATTAIGQGTAVTPIQIIQAATAIANEGKMMKPYIVDSISNSATEEVVYEGKPEVKGEPISPETSEEVLGLMEQVVVSSSGTGRPYFIEGFNVVGKTGTAQIPNPDGGGYLSGNNQNIFSFIGMAPKDDPSIIVYVAVDRPNLAGDESGSAPVSMIFNSVMKQSLQYLNIEPAVSEEAVYEEDGIEIPELEGESVEEAESILHSLGLQPVFLGDGETVEEMSPGSESNVIFGERVLIKTEGASVMPDITGWSMRDATKLSDLAGMELHHIGSGYVTDQSIPAGTGLEGKGYLTVEMMSPQEIRDLREEEAAAQEEAETEESSREEDSEDEEERIRRE
ncbi:penicillin-binding protein [Bacillus sp. FJAT-44742]|uniref:penicillin-binding protein n=1 Tax=Bacillus sp. FJAT-44742 TaxID=2014005 RepID=UPI000C24257A|nr:penicillin-binding protein [Bacillus sp. FJAT-44742]